MTINDQSEEERGFPRRLAVVMHVTQSPRHLFDLGIMGFIQFQRSQQPRFKSRGRDRMKRRTIVPTAEGPSKIVSSRLSIMSST
jgi:hypothetical protein